MDQINVQRWASSLRQFHRNDLQSSIASDVCAGSPNGVRIGSTATKVFALDEQRNRMSEDSDRISKSQFYTYDMSTKDEKNLHSLSTTEYSDHLSPDHHDADTVSDAGTYVIEDDQSEQKINPSSSSSFKRYVKQSKNRHGTFDIHGLLSSTAHTIHRPVVDANFAKKDLSFSSSSNSSLLSFDDDEEKIFSVPQHPTTPPKQTQIKPAESFVISPIFETKSFSTRNIPRTKLEDQSKSKLPTRSVPSREANLEPVSPLSSVHTNQNSAEKESFHLQNQPPPLKTSTRPHTTLHDQKSSFQRPTTSANAQFQRQTSSISTTDSDQTTPNLSKAFANQPFMLRQQQSNVASSTSKPSPRQLIKPIPSAASTAYSNHQTNRAVELRRARAQAKIEELTQRTKKQFYRPNKAMDVMSASWHSNPSNSNRKDLSNLRAAQRMKNAPQKEDLYATRTLSSSLYQPSTSTSPNPIEEIQEQHRPKMTTSAYSVEEGRCDALRDNGQRLAIRLIQLSSGILEKLKPNDIVTAHELEQMVDQLQTVNRTLSSIDAALTGSINDDAFV